MIKKIQVKNATILVSLVCNLNCKLCAVSAPYRKDNKFETVETLISYIDKFFSIVDYVDKFAVTGGEPLVFKELPEFLSELLKYSDHYGKIEIHTNGVLLPSTKLLEQIKRYGDKFDRLLIDNYGADLSVNAVKIAEILKENSIPYSLRDYYSENAHYGGWVDFGDLSKKINSNEESERIYSLCNYPQKLGLCNQIYRGYVFECCPQFRRYIDGTINSDEYLNLNDETMTVEQQKEKFLKLQNAKSFATCAYCHGFFDESPRFKPAEQLSSPKEKREGE